MNGCNSHRQTVFHQYEFAHDLAKAMVGRRIFRMFRIYMVMCGYECAFLKPIKMCSLCYKIYKRKTFEFGLYNEVVGAWHTQIVWRSLSDILYTEMVLKKPYLVALNYLV